MTTPPNPPCPACGCTCGGQPQPRRGRIYNRHISKGQAISLGRMLLWTRENYDGGPELPFMHIPTTIGRGSSEEHKLALWGLIEEEHILRPDGGRAGWWRLTRKGILFVRGDITVPWTAVTGPGNTLIRLEGKDWSIHDAYGAPFDLREI
jgi:hypothetical protein